ILGVGSSTMPNFPTNRKCKAGGDSKPSFEACKLYVFTGFFINPACLTGFAPNRLTTALFSFDLEQLVIP
ncbi:MAG TPA: hypothetical protein VF243_07665, partial [Nitrosospira sp.]